MKFDKRLLAQLNNVRAWFALTILIGFVIGILTIAQARTLSAIVAQVFLQHATLDGVWGMMLALLAVIGARAILAWASEASAFQIAARIKSDLRVQVFSKLLALGPAFSRGERTGELTNTLTEGIEALDAYYSQYLPQLVLAVLVPVSILAFVFPLDWLSGLVLLFTGPLIPFFMILIGGAADTLTRKQYKQLALMSAHFLDVLQGLTTLKIFGRSRDQAETIARVSNQFRDTTMSVLRVAFLSAFALEMIATISTAIVAVQVGLRLLYGQLEFEQAFFVLVLAPDFYLPLRLLGTRFHAGMSGVAAGARIFEILEETEDGRPKTNNLRPPSSVLGRVTFKDVHFSYPGNSNALSCVSFIIERGQHVALVGATGAGKSTIVNLLLRFVEPTRGEIDCDDHAIDEWSSAEWRNQIAWVPQMPYLFNDTVANNIRLAHPGAPMSDVVRAAQSAHADEFIRALPQGYDTIIGERGARLSGGQAQRLALARAFLKDAQLLILDEATSNLDVENEAAIQDSVERLMANKTALIISHRPNTIARADRIIVLDHGRVIQLGALDELVREQGRYRQLVTAHAQPVIEPETTRDISTPTTADEFQNENQKSKTCGEQSDSIENPLLALLRFASPFKWWIALAVLLGSLTIGSSIGLMATSAFIIASAALHPSVADLAVPIVGVRFFGIARGVFRYLERYVSHYINFSLLARLRVWFYQAIEPLAPARLTQYRSGDLLTRIVSDIETLQNFYVRIIAPPMVAVVIAMAMFVFLVGFSSAIALTVLAFMLLVGLVVPFIVQRLSRAASQTISQARVDLYAHLVDSIQGIADLIAYGREQAQAEGIGTLGQKMIAAQRWMALLTGAHTAAGNLLTNLAMWATLWLAIPLVNAGQIEGVYLPGLALAVLACFEGALAMPIAFQYLESNRQSARRLFDLASSTEDRRPKTEDKPSNSVIGLPSSVMFENVSLRYASDEPLALDGVSFDLSAGKTMAIVGTSGSGKTTIVNALLRFWDYTGGRIILGGRELRDYTPDVARQFFAVVAQPTHLFNATIRENLLLARADATESEMIDAARQAQIHDFIAALPQGYDTRIGEQGLRLSGGERQRLAIARALLKNAPILICDEATANLDPGTEQAVLRSIREAAQNRTTLIITHRLIGLEDVDEVLVMQAGRIIEQGKHFELLKHDGAYSKMWKLAHAIFPNTNEGERNADHQP